jgi:hypothetical protein
VFADDHRLVKALVSTYEGVNEVGLSGGNLRSLYADFLKEAGKITGRSLGRAERAYRKAAESWDAFAAICIGVPIVKEVVELDRERRNAIRQGDLGWDDAALAGARSERLLRSDVDLGDGDRRKLFEQMAEALRIVHGNEVTALESMVAAVG